MREFPRTGKRGRGKKPKQMPLTKLKYAQIIKRKDGDKPLKITKKIIFGDPKSIDQPEISTSHIERQNLNLRQENKRLARKTIAYFKRRWMATIPSYITYDYT